MMIRFIFVLIVQLFADKIREVYNFPLGIFPFDELHRGALNLSQLCTATEPYWLIDDSLLSIALDGLGSINEPEDRTMVSQNFIPELVDQWKYRNNDEYDDYENEYSLTLEFDQSLEVGTSFEVIIGSVNSTIYRSRRDLSNEQNNFAFQVRLQNDTIVDVTLQELLKDPRQYDPSNLNSR